MGRLPRCLHHVVPALALTAIVAAASSVTPVRAQVLLHEIASPNEEEYGAFGRSVSSVSDLDGDGLRDLLVGALWENPGTSLDGAGRAYVFSGATGALIHELASPHEEEDGFFGYDVSSVEDVDDDGRGDLLVGAPNEDPGASPHGAGRAYVFSGASGALLFEFVSPNEEHLGSFGSSVSGVEDIDDDGHGDVVVGAPNEALSQGATDAGRAYAFSGATGALLYEIASLSPEPDGAFGSSVSVVEDLDGDGGADLVIGAPGEWDHTGRAHVFSGSTGAFLHALASANPGARTGDFGSSVSGVPDADGDDGGDFIVGAPFEYKNGVAAAGGAYVFTGATGERLHTLEAPPDHLYFGASVAGISDVDGDGRGDLLVGSYSETANSSVVHTFSGATGGLLLTLVSPHPQPFGGFGVDLSEVGDVDGDGRADLLVGASGESLGSTPEGAGRAYVFSGATVTATEGAPPTAFALLASRPNPASSRTALAFVLPAPSWVRLAVYDVLGREVAVLVDGEHAAGWHEAVLDAWRLSSGPYLVRLEAGGAVQTQRLTLVR